MNWNNTSTEYGAITKFFHWAVFLLFFYQFVVARTMMAITQADSVLGFTQDVMYNWHKSVGIILFAIILFRYAWRRTSRLPDWAATLSDGEKKLIHGYERLFYLAMFVMPLSGYLHVMAGGYGVMFFGRWALPNPMGKVEWLGEIGKYTHLITGWVILIAVLLHVGLVLKHQLIQRDRLLMRMWPFTRQ
jgi:cytochrome b561